MQPAAVFGKYEVIATLGQGGMAEVFLAVLRGPSGFTKLVVIKAMNTSVRDDPQFTNMLFDEARLAARLQHPNVVQTFEVGEVHGTPFIAMEYLDGQSLHALILAARESKQILDPSISAYIIKEVLAGLHYAHELNEYDGRRLGIIHRDVTPHNIFVTYEGEVKVVDFGIAKAATNLAKTAAGFVKGKVAYMAPEQAVGGAIDRRVDIFATGLVLWELLSGKRLFDDASPIATIDRLLSEPIPPVGSIRPIHPALDAIVSQALMKDPKARFQSALEMRAALHPFSGTVDREDLGKLVRGAFQDARAERQRQLRESVGPTADQHDAPTLTMHVTPTADDAEARAREHRSEPGTQQSVTTPPSRRQPVWTWAAGLLGIAILGILAFFVLRPLRTNSIATAHSTESVLGVPPTEDVILRLQGSNTVGAALAPALVEAFLRHKGAVSVVRESSREQDHVRISGTFAGKSAPQVVEITSLGSETAFTGLAHADCDIGMSSRPITEAERADLQRKGLGDLTSTLGENVIALDGIAVVVHASNPLRALSIDQIAAVLSGGTSDWAALGGPSGHINLYVHDQRSGTLDVLKKTLGVQVVAPGAKQFEDNVAVSSAVAADPRGLGFVGLAYVGDTNALAVSSRDGDPMVPSPFTIARETYFFTRRIYMYASEGGRARDFLRFVQSDEGQKVVRSTGFVDLNIGVTDTNPCVTPCPSRYASITKHARRLSLDFRFRETTYELDSRGAHDIDRLVSFLREKGDGHIVLFGLSDVTPPGKTSVEDSLACAKVVDTMLRERGVNPAVVDGFGAALPLPFVGHLAHPNRRVEVWMQSDSP